MGKSNIFSLDVIHVFQKIQRIRAMLACPFPRLIALNIFSTMMSVNKKGNAIWAVKKRFN